jgi:alkylated DNA repair dioxygenase AlkB
MEKFLVNYDPNIEINDKNKNINIKYIDKFLDEEKTLKYFKILQKHLLYNSDEMSSIKIMGKTIKIPRKQVAYSENSIKFPFSGISVSSLDWNKEGKIEKIIRKIKKLIEKISGKKFNFVLINYYEDGSKYIGKHHDDETSMLHGCITGISFGAKRKMVFTYDKYKEHFYLSSGSLILINEPTNKYYTHEITKDLKCTEPRISLTFRLLKENLI